MADRQEILEGDKSFTLKAKDLLELDNVAVLQNIGNTTVIYSKEELTEDNRGFKLNRSDVLILSKNSKLYIKSMSNYSKVKITASAGGY